ncbi:hypothetical protein V8C86DRAFT_2510899 [Haematococcus lacustris]
MFSFCLLCFGSLLSLGLICCLLLFQPLGTPHIMHKLCPSGGVYRSSAKNGLGHRAAARRTGPSEGRPPPKLHNSP